LKLLYENKKQARKLKFVLWFSLFVALLAVYSSWMLFNSYGLSAADGGVLKPFGTRLLLAGFIASLGLAFAGGMMLFATLYLLKVEQDGDTVLVQTMPAFGVGINRRQFKRADIESADYRSGKFVADLSVNAPWVKLKLKRQRLPLILDMQAETVKSAALKKLAAF